ncbi:MAG: YicC family protein [Bacillaceae bacterium]|nr:YicC family protein [Bacillaceae bacterium]
MLVSMTGYGQGYGEIDGYKISIEMKSINHRFCEVNVRMPRQFLFLEDRFKKIVGKYIKRGKVDVFISVDGDDFVQKSFKVNWDLFDEFQYLFNEAKTRINSNQQFSLEQILLHPDITTICERETTSENLINQIIRLTEFTANNLFAMRKNEGDSLAKDLIKRLNTIDFIVSEVATRAPNVVVDYRNRLLKRVEDFLDGKMEVDEARILSEVAIFADKANIDEELTRLNSHLKQFISIINDTESVVGRKLDFLVQEMNREINTIGSKSNDLQISTQVVSLKAELEKIKEQVQNIE